MDAENIYKRPPILFAEESEGEKYRRKQEEITAKLLEATESKNVTEFLVKLIYGEDFHLPARLLQTKISATGEDVLALADGIEKIESYNNIRGKDLAEVIRYLHNGGYVMEVQFGREGSPVVYVDPPYWTHQASNSKDREGRMYGKEERAYMFKEIELALRKLDPDELDYVEFYGVRAWWD